MISLQWLREGNGSERRVGWNQDGEGPRQYPPWEGRDPFAFLGARAVLQREVTWGCSWLCGAEDGKVTGRGSQPGQRLG